jgi:hypothetical protein
MTAILCKCGHSEYWHPKGYCRFGNGPKACKCEVYDVDVTEPKQNPLGLPYDPNQTPQVRGRKAEKAMGQTFGARMHPMSGAGSIKDDASNDVAVYEFKNVQKTHTINGSALKGLWRRAIKQDKTPMYVIYFEDDDLTVICSITKGKHRP